MVGRDQVGSTLAGKYLRPVIIGSFGNVLYLSQKWLKTFENWFVQVIWISLRSLCCWFHGIGNRLPLIVVTVLVSVCIEYIIK